MILFRLLTLRPLMSRPTRLLLPILGVMLGVSLYVAVDLINGATVDFFRETVDALSGQATLSIVGDEGGFPESVLETIEHVQGVKHAVPLVETRARFRAGEGKSAETLVILGIDLLRESSVRTYKTVDEQVIDDPLEFLNQVDSIIVTKSFAAEHGLKIDSKFSLDTIHGVVPFTVRGILSPTGPAKAFGGRVAVMDIDGARVSFGKEDKLDRIDIVPKSGIDERELQRRIEAALTPELRVERPDTQAAALNRMVEGFEASLSFMSSLALVVAAFLVANVMGVSVVERRREIGVLRAIGTTRGRILLMILSEAAILGLVGAATGGALGRLIAASLVKDVSRSLSIQYVTPIEVTKITMTTGRWILAILAGVIAALLAAARPAIAATRVPSVEALRPKEADLSPTRAGGAAWRWGVGLGLLGYVAVSAALHIDAHAVGLRVLTAVAAMAGAVVVSPALADLALRAQSVLVATGRLGPTPILRLAIENLVSHQGRTASGIVSVVVGLMFVLVTSTVRGSFAKTLNDAAERSLSADVFVSSNGRFLSGQVQPVSEDLVKEIDRVVGVDARGGARAMRLVHVSYAGSSVALKAWDPVLPDRSPFNLQDRPEPDATRELFDPAAPSVMVSENFAAHFAKRTGDSLDLQTPSGPMTFRVVGVVSDFASPQGTVYMARALYKRVYKDPLVTVFFVYAAPGTSSLALRDAIDSAVCQPHDLVAMPTEQVKQDLRQTVDQAFAFVGAIESAALLVGLFGLVNTALIHVFERRRELGMLRAVGMSRGQLRLLVLLESVLQGGIAALLAAVLGTYICTVWMGSAVALASGWPIVIHVPWGAVSATLALGVAAGAVAGLLAARRATAVTIREALEYE